MNHKNILFIAAVTLSFLIGFSFALAINYPPVCRQDEWKSVAKMWESTSNTWKTLDEALEEHYKGCIK